MKSIKKIKLFNFKRFKNIELEFDEKINILIGDNESGKSTILLAVDLVLSGRHSKVESIGLENLLNNEVVKEFLSGDKNFNQLPILTVEIYLNEQHNFNLNGKNNSEGVPCDGLCLVCEPITELSSEITDILQQDTPNFPFEYYAIKFFTFSGESYTGYRKFLKHLALDQ